LHARFEAQSGRVGIGIHAAYNVSDLNEPAAGGHVIVALPAGLSIYPAIRSYVVASGSLWRVSTVLRWVPKAAALQPYVGVGAYWTRSSAGAVSATDMGVLDEVGTEFLIRKLQPFAEVRLLKDGAVSAELAAGIRLVFSDGH